MADPALSGNGTDCPACALRRDDLRAAKELDQVVDCNFRGGSGRVGRAVADIIQEAVNWAAKHYWPAREADFSKHNDKGLPE